MDENSQVSDEIASGDPPASPSERSVVTVLLAVLLAAGLLIYAVCLFKNISYPLMWADESMTAVGAERVLDYGYPKVHDGRNIFYDLRHTDLTLGIDRKTDAYIGGAGWGHYYFAAPFAFLAQFTSDIYEKTAILRIPFALAGCAGLLLLLWTGTRSLATRQSRLALAVLFVILELPSVTLMLHLREVRYYSLQLLLTSVALSVFAAYHLRSSIGYRAYAAAVVCLVPLLFLTFSPASAAFCITVCLYLVGEWAISSTSQEGKFSSMRAQLKVLSPALASLVLVVPIAWFFKTLYISRQLEEFYRFTFSTYIDHLGVVWGYFARFEVFFFAVAAKLILPFYWRRVYKDTVSHTVARLSLLLSIYFIAMVLFIGKVPNPIFTRYFITLQPLLVLSFVLDLSILARLAREMNAWRRTAAAAVVTILLAGSVGWVFSQNRNLIKGHLYEISHQYQGVLDFVIPYIQKHYAHPEQLVIATNYEETSYEFYLGCRVIGGFLMSNLAQDLMERPDCIMFRKEWTNFTDKNVYDYFLGRDVYETVRFPVYDYSFNNIPEAAHWSPIWGWQRIMHVFRTDVTDDPAKQAAIYIRKDSATPGPSVQDGGSGIPVSPQPRQE